MSPFADTMGFIDSDASQFSLRVDDSKDPAEVVALTEFWCYVEQASQGVTTLEVSYDPLFVYLWCGAVDRLDSDVGIAQRGNLVVLVTNEH